MLRFAHLFISFSVLVSLCHAFTPASSFIKTSVRQHHHSTSFKPSINVHQPLPSYDRNRRSTHSASTESSDKGNADDGRLLGVLVLLTVPLSWGTYAPVVKYVYEMNPPVPGFVFSAGYYVIASFTLNLLVTMMSISNSDQTAMGNSAISEIEGDDETSSNLLPLQALAGIELGSYLFIGNCLQVVGLKTVPADRAAFLVQLTTIMVPLFQAGLAGDFRSIPPATWTACLLAFAGVIIMGLDRPDVDIQSLFDSVDGLAHGLSFSGGDSLIVLAAVSYTMHVIRLGRYAKFTSPLGLAASKATVEAALSIGLVAGLVTMGASTDIGFINDMSSEIHSYFGQLQDAVAAGTFPPADSTKAIGAVLWTGWVTCAYTIYAQSFGQQRVSPTDANLIYTMQPIFSALFAYALLGESLGAFGFGGALLIGFALWVVTSAQAEAEDDEQESKQAI